MARVFISYAREDRDAAAELAAALGQRGHEVWWDWHLVGGADFREAINARLEAAEKVVVLWSSHSVSSDFVVDEAGLARAKGKLVPVSLDGAAPPLGFRALHTIDWAPGSGDIAPLAAALAGESVSEAEIASRARLRRWRRVAAIGLAIGAVAVASALAVRWIPEPAVDLCPRYDMAGSVMRLEQSGGTVRVVYENVRETLRPDGWKTGDWLFEGKVAKAAGVIALDGRARSHGVRCGFVEYPVRGTMEPATRAITLQGSMPVRRLDCSVMGARQDTISMTCRQ